MTTTHLKSILSIILLSGCISIADPSGEDKWNESDKEEEDWEQEGEDWEQEGDWEQEDDETPLQVCWEIFVVCLEEGGDFDVCQTFMNSCMDLFQEIESETENSDNDGCVELYEDCIDNGIDAGTCSSLLMECLNSETTDEQSPAE